MKKILIVASLLLITVPRARNCSLVEGYFYQVTALRGKIVGAGTLHLESPRWFRQSFARKHVTLQLREYRSPSSRNEMPLVKTAETDGDGKFDFGPIQPGHYTLFIGEESSDLPDHFDVEIRNLPLATESVTIDVSPIHPDCRGGHEFLIRTK